MDNARSTPAIHWINFYPLNGAIVFVIIIRWIYSDILYIEWRYPAIEQLWPVCY